MKNTLCSYCIPLLWKFGNLSVTSPNQNRLERCECVSVVIINDVKINDEFILVVKLHNGKQILTETIITRIIIYRRS
jgi:hypothetical protein